jgi:hypothetical protein
LAEDERVWSKSDILLAFNNSNEVKSMQTIFRIFKIWLPLAIATAGLSGLAYLTVQQALRIGANDPQIQMAEDAASALNGGASVDSIVPNTRVELSTSLAPFIIVFDDSGKVVASMATLHGSVPVYPAGVLDYTRQHGEDRVTWQPENGVRMATVVVRYDKGFIVAGRSLREVEIRIGNIQNICGLAVLAIWVATLFVIVLGELIGPRKNA